MVYFFRSPEGQIIAVGSQTAFSAETAKTLKWLFSDAELLQEPTVAGTFIGPRREMITPWSTAAVEITRNMNISGISRIEEYFPVEAKFPTTGCSSAYTTVWTERYSP